MIDGSLDNMNTKNLIVHEKDRSTKIKNGHGLGLEIGKVDASR